MILLWSGAERIHILSATIMRRRQWNRANAAHHPEIQALPLPGAAQGRRREATSRILRNPDERTRGALCAARARLLSMSTDGFVSASMKLQQILAGHRRSHRRTTLPRKSSPTMLSFNSGVALAFMAFMLPLASAFAFLTPTTKLAGQSSLAAGLAPARNRVQAVGMCLPKDQGEGGGSIAQPCPCCLIRYLLREGNARSSPLSFPLSFSPLSRSVPTHSSSSKEFTALPLPRSSDPAEVFKFLNQNILFPR